MRVLLTDLQVELAFQLLARGGVDKEMPESLRQLPPEAWEQLGALLLSLYQQRAMSTLH